MLLKTTLGLLVLLTTPLTLFLGFILYSIYYPKGPTSEEIQASVQPVKVFNVTLTANSSYDIALTGNRQYCMALTTPNRAIGPGHLSELHVLVNNVEFPYKELPIYVSIDPIATWQYKLPFSVDRPLTLEFKPSTEYSGPNRFSANIMICQTDHLMDQSKRLSIDKIMRDNLSSFWTYFALTSVAFLVSSYFLYRVLRR